LASRIARVIATDISPAQIRHAKPLERVEFRVARAEESGLPVESVDLITVAQAIHWVDHAAFWAEACRVARVGCVLGVWCYQKPEVGPAIDRLVNGLYDAPCLAPYWPSERRVVDNGYRDIQLPGREVSTPSFYIRENWPLRRFAMYLTTWPALSECAMDPKASGYVAKQFEKLREAWGRPDAVRPVTWRLSVRAWIL
jgi:ubiquinone/menaquinone biosynthesis C-methylase UbiE